MEQAEQRKKQYAIRKINRLIKELEDIRDFKLEEELRLSFFNLYCCLDYWLSQTVYMSDVINPTVKKRRNANSDDNDYKMTDDEEIAVINTSPS